MKNLLLFLPALSRAEANGALRLHLRQHQIALPIGHRGRLRKERILERVDIHRATRHQLRQAARIRSGCDQIIDNELASNP